MARYLLGESAARKLRSLMNATTSGATPGPSSELAFASDFPLPFSIQWAASVGEEEDGGAWIVWIPDGHSLIIDGAAVNPAAELEPAGGDYPSGWYALPDEIESDVYLIISEDSEAGYSATFAGEASTEEGDVSILIATLDSEKRSKPIVNSALVIGSGGAVVDGISIGKTEDGALQLAHFADEEWDESAALVEKLRADKDSGEITASDDGLWLVGYRDGHVVYLPLAGGAAPGPTDPNGDPCEHGGSAGENGGGAGTKPGDEDSGGVSAGQGEMHGDYVTPGIGATEGQSGRGCPDCNC